MMVKVTPQQSRVLAVLLLALFVAIVLVALIWPPLALHHRYNDEIARQQDLLERYQGMVAQKPQVESALEAIRKHDGRRFFLKSTAVNLAGAELQENVRNVLESSGARITSSQNIAPKEDGDFTKISINVQFFSNAANLQKALNTSELKTPYLIIDNLVMRPTNMSRSYKPVAGQEPEINVQLEVSGWVYRSGDAKQGGAS